MNTISYYLKKKLTLSEINNTKLFQNEDFRSLKDVLIKTQLQSLEI